MKRIVVLCSLIAVDALRSCSPGFAHHSNHTSPLRRPMELSAWDDMSKDGERDRIALALSYQSSFFGKWHQGAKRYDQSNLGGVVQQMLTMGLTMSSSTGSAVGAQLPVGLMSLLLPACDTGSNCDVHHAMGLGDLQLFGEQNLLQMMRWSKTSQFFLRVGLRVPTGRYEPNLQLSLTDISASVDTLGTINSTTFNTQANLGAGSWAGVVALRFIAQLMSLVNIVLDTSLTTPLNRTQEGYRWGLDSLTSAQIGVDILPNHITVIVGGDYLWHQRDLVPDISTAADLLVGGRRELGILFGVQVGRRSKLPCALSMHLPVYQQVGGIQLVETLSGQIGCTMAW